VWKEGNLEVWSKPLHDGSRAVVLLNRGIDEKKIGVNWEDLGYPAHLTAKVRDLWQEKELGEFKGMFSASVAPHSVVMVTIRP
jgi:alpha-galactosidase